MSAILNRRHTQEYIYDFDEDGGATGEIFLSSKAGMKPIPNGAIITSVLAFVEAAIVGTSSTLAWGNDDDPDGYSGTAIAEATLVDNFNANGWDNAASLIWDDTNDHPIHVTVVDEDDGEFSVTIGTANLTAGKVKFMVDFYMPGQAG